MTFLPTRFKARTLIAASALVLSSALANAADVERTITLTGHGEISAAPDSATISGGVSTTAPTAAGAVASNASAMTSIFATLKKLGIADKNIRTSGFFVGPQYAPYNANNPTQRIIGYQASNQLTITIDHVSNVGATIDALAAAGANQMNSVSFMIHNPKPLQDDARRAAVDDAMARAELLTKAAHVALGPVLSISEGGGYTMPRPVMFAARASALEAPPPPPTPVAAGEETVSADVTITWEIR